MNVASSAEDVQQLSRRRTQEADSEVSQIGAGVYQSIARRMLSYLDFSEALKVGAKELEEYVLALDESSINMGHIARQARSVKKCSRSFSRQGATKIMITSVARWEEHLRMLEVLKRECLDLTEAIENLSEKEGESVFSLSCGVFRREMRGKPNNISARQGE